MPKLRAPKEQPKQEDDSANATIGSSSEEQNVNEQETLASSDDQSHQTDDQNQDDASLALQKQLEELRKSEELQRQQAAQNARERDDAIRRARERDVEIAKFQKEAESSQFDAISSAIAAASAEADKATLDIENAANLGDNKAQAEAYRRLARAEANIAKLEGGKVAIEEKRKEVPQQSAQQNNSSESEPLAHLPERAKSWIRSHQDYLSDPRKNAKLNALHWEAIDAGNPEYEDGYFDFIETGLGMRQPRQQSQQTNTQNTQQRNPQVSAPVSREAPSSSNQTRGSLPRLTPQQREAAKMAGITEVEYLKQAQKLAEMKANGTYGDRQ